MSKVRFSRREQVWAKVEPFPWWPGKIVNIHIQARQIIYKILFYNDPTYAYLQEQHIAPFNDFDRQSNTQYQHNSRLARAVSMADQAFAKTESMRRQQDAKISLELKKTSEGEEQEPIVHPQRAITPIISNQKHQQSQGDGKEQGKVVSGHQIEQAKCEETAFSPFYQPQEQSLRLPPVMESITRENIIHILTARGEQERLEYDYENRKKIIIRKAELKQRLLERYNLHQLCQEDTRAEGESHRKGKNSRHRLHRKKMACQSIKHFREKCIKKLYMTAKKSVGSMHELNLKQISVDLITRLAQVSEENQLRFKSLFIALIKSIQTSHSQSFPDKIAAFTGCLDRFQNEKPEDEEGSKMTQVSQGH